MASYYWGERRIISKLKRLMEGVPDTPVARSYRRFHGTYEDRMSEETKGYVINIFWAVTGENPRVRFDFDNRLEKYMRTPVTEAR